MPHVGGVQVVGKQGAEVPLCEEVVKERANQRAEGALPNVAYMNQNHSMSLCGVYFPISFTKYTAI